MKALQEILEDPESHTLDRVFRIQPHEVKDEDLDRVIEALRTQRAVFLANGEKPRGKRNLDDDGRDEKTGGSYNPGD